MKALRCPACGADSHSVAFGRGDVPDPQPVSSTRLTDRDRRAAWLKLHDDGLSSRCIADRMCGNGPSGDYPRDGGDFGRCERLLILYPEWRARLGEMVTVSEHWAALVPRWDDIVLAWRHDAELWRTQGKKAPRSEWKCYDLMQGIFDSARVAA